MWNDERIIGQRERIIGQRERIIGQRERIIGQRSRNNRENNVEIWNRIIGKFLGIIGSGLYSHGYNNVNIQCWMMTGLGDKLSAKRCGSECRIVERAHVGI